jgi:Tol biopolymer transport system component
MILLLLRPLLSLWFALLLALSGFRLLGTLPPCLCLAYSAPPADYGFTELRLWDASIGISLSLAASPYMGDVISPQNREYIAYSQGISLVILSTNGERRQIEFPSSGMAAPHVSPDGNYLSYTIAPRSGDGLYLRQIDSLQQRLIAPFPMSVTWLPDSQSLLYSLRNRRENRFELYQLHIESNERALILTNDRGYFDMDLSPDGQSLLYIKQRQLWRYDFHTQHNYPLDTKELSRMPRWSADSRHYAYQIRRADGLYLRIVSSDGSSMTFLNDAINPMQAFVWWQPQ